MINSNNIFIKNNCDYHYVPLYKLNFAFDSIFATREKGERERERERARRRGREVF
jgi:hypothetical protein